MAGAMARARAFGSASWPTSEKAVGAMTDDPIPITMKLA